MQVDCLFDHTRINVISTTQNQVLHAVDQEKVSLFVHVSDIARTEPSVAQTLGRFFRTVEVPLHDLWTLDPDLSPLTHGHRIMWCLKIVNGNLCARHHLADRPGFVCVIHSVTGRDGCGLTQAIAFDQAATGQSFESFFDLQRQGRSARDAIANC